MAHNDSLAQIASAYSYTSIILCKIIFWLIFQSLAWNASWKIANKLFHQNPGGNQKLLYFWKCKQCMHAPSTNFVPIICPITCSFNQGGGVECPISIINKHSTRYPRDIYLNLYYTQARRPPLFPRETITPHSTDIQTMYYICGYSNTRLSSCINTAPNRFYRGQG